MLLVCLYICVVDLQHTIFSSSVYCHGPKERLRISTIGGKMAFGVVRANSAFGPVWQPKWGSLGTLAERAHKRGSCALKDAWNFWKLWGFSRHWWKLRGTCREARAGRGCTCLWHAKTRFITARICQKISKRARQLPDRPNSSRHVANHQPRDLDGQTYFFAYKYPICILLKRMEASYTYRAIRTLCNHFVETLWAFLYYLSCKFFQV